MAYLDINVLEKPDEIRIVTASCDNRLEENSIWYKKIRGESC
jgi:hypothetical protein